MKTAVSIPDPLFEAADRLARRRRMSRSALYAEALELLLANDTDDAWVTAQLDAVYSGQESRVDPMIEAANTTLLLEQW